MKFKKGDRVKLITNKWGDYENNPRWGGEFGKMLGTISADSLEDTDFTDSVKWDNGKINSYKKGDLGFISHKQYLPDELFQL